MESPHPCTSILVALVPSSYLLRGMKRIVELDSWTAVTQSDKFVERLARDEMRTVQAPALSHVDRKLFSWS